MNTARISFDEEPDEYVVRLSPVSLRDYGAIIELYTAALSESWPESLLPLYAKFAPLIAEWSFPERITAKALESRDPNTMLALVREWASGVRRAPLPLPRRSSDTAPSEDPSP